MLPPHMRKQLERRMLAKRFSDYEGLAEWVGQQGYDISGDSLWRYGKSLKQEFTATQFSLLQARMLAAQAPDHKGPADADSAPSGSAKAVVSISAGGSN